ncbi:MAG: hypothetical protein ACOY41_09420 [Pseudomonadota bacterium]
MNHKKLLLPLLAVVILATVAGIARLLCIGTQLHAESPLALAAMPDGGFVLGTDRQLLMFDHKGELQRRRQAVELGLQEPGAVQITADGTLWVFDRKRRQLFECPAALTCTARSDAALDLDRNALFAVSPAQGLIAISDNNQHRLLLLDRQGRLLLDSKNAPPLHYPNHVQFDGDSLLLADADRYVILRIPFTTTPELALQAPQTVLATQRRPYRFARTDSGWWVIEAGETLNDGELVFYAADGSRHRHETSALDPVDFLFRDDHLIVASRRDRWLLRIDTASGGETTLGSADLKEEWRALALREQLLLRERERIPLLMLLVLLPLLFLALFLKSQEQRKAEERRSEQIDTEQVDALKAGRPVTLRPDAEGEKTIRQERNTVLGIALAGLVLVPGFCWVIAGAPGLPALRSHELRPLLLIIGATVPLLLIGAAFGVVQYRHRLSRVLRFTATGVELHEAGKVKASAPYGEVRLEQAILQIGRHALPLYLNPLQRVSPFWPRAQIKALLEGRQPPPAAALRRDDGELQFETSADDARQLRRQRLVIRVVVIGGMTLSALAAAWLMVRHPTLSPLLLLPMAGLLLVYLLALLFLERRYARLIETRLVLGPDSLRVLKDTRLEISVPYAEVWLGENLLVAGRRSVRLAMRRNNLSARSIELFPLDLLRDTLKARLPASQIHATDIALLLAMLRQGHRYSIRATLRTTALILLAVAAIFFDHYLKS